MRLKSLRQDWVEARRSSYHRYWAGSRLAALIRTTRIPDIRTGTRDARYRAIVARPG